MRQWRFGDDYQIHAGARRRDHARRRFCRRATAIRNWHCGTFVPQCFRKLLVLGRIGAEESATSAPIFVRCTAATAGTEVAPFTAEIPLAAAAETAAVAVATGHGVTRTAEPAERNEAAFLAFVEALVERVQGLTELLERNAHIRHGVSAPAHLLGRIRGR